MALETATYISGLTPTNPVSNDSKSQGDDHLRLLKAVAQNTFPNADKPFYFPAAEAQTGDFTVDASDQNRTFLVSTASAAVVMTLPSLAVGDAGWECSLIKTNTGSNPVFITPASGTIQSGEYTGLAKARRVIPGRRTKILWTGSAWIAERVESSPIGTVKDYMFSTLPVGYEFPYGQTLSSASSNYPEFYAANSNSGVMPDVRGRVIAGKDNMGGSSADRLTAQTAGVDGDTLLAVGGAETHTLSEAQLPALTKTLSLTDPGHTHAVGANSIDGNAGSNSYLRPGTGANTGSATTGITGTVSFGSGGAHNNVQPTIVFNKIVVVE